MKKLSLMAAGILLTASLVAYAATNMDEKKPQAPEKKSCAAAVNDKSSCDKKSCEMKSCDTEKCNTKNCPSSCNPGKK